MPYKNISLAKFALAAYKLKPDQAQMMKFKSIVDRFQLEMDESKSETEDTQKTIFRDLLRDNFGYSINSLRKQDLAIKVDNKVQVIIESKRTSNKAEMCFFDKDNGNCDLNKKALHELVLYYFRERILNNNLEIKHLIITNQQQFFIITGVEFKRFFMTKQLVDEFKKISSNSLDDNSTDTFYKDIAKPMIARLLETDTLEFAYFDIRDYYDQPMEKLVELYKVFCPQVLLKQSFGNDNNSLDLKFYKELLYIMGLEEIAGGKIARISKNRQLGSLLEDTLDYLDIEDQDLAFEKGLELVITWVNRVLFIKLLEGQIVAWNSEQTADQTIKDFRQQHYGKNQAHKFEFLGQIQNYGQLKDLFFDVLAKPIADRKER